MKNKYKITTEQAKALMGAKSLINTDGKVFDITQEGGQAYVMIYKSDLFFKNLQYLKSMFGGLGRKFDYNTPISGATKITGDEFIF